VALSLSVHPLLKAVLVVHAHPAALANVFDLDVAHEHVLGTDAKEKELLSVGLHLFHIRIDGKDFFGQEPGNLSDRVVERSDLRKILGGGIGRDVDGGNVGSLAHGGGEELSSEDALKRLLRKGARKKIVST